MKLAIEPKEVDLIVEPHRYSEEDDKLMSRIIEHYKKTGELLKVNTKEKKSKNKRKEIMKP